MKRTPRKDIIKVSVAGLLILSATVAWAITMTFKHAPGSSVTLVTFASLGNGLQTSPGTEFDPITTGGGYLKGDIECALTFSANPVSTSTVDVWLLTAPDGTNYEDTANGRMPDVSCPVTAGQNTTRVTMRDVNVPSFKTKGTAFNNGSGVTLSSGTVKLFLHTQKGE